MEEEIILTAKYGDFDFRKRFVMSGASKENALAVLAHISAEIEPWAYMLGGLDGKRIDEFAKGATDLKDAAGLLDKTPQNAIKKMLNEAVGGEEKLVPLAESYLIRKLLENAGAPFKITPKMYGSPPRSEPFGNDGVIAFIANWNNWISIKKLSVDAKTEGWEVAGLLSSANNTIVNKMFDLACAKKDDALVQRLCAGKRKSYKNLAGVLSAIADMGGGANGTPESAYVLAKSCETLGIKPYASTDMLAQAHPEVKGVKMRGRKPKG